MIARYLFREILQTMLAVTLILVFIFLCNDLVRYLGYIAKGKYALGVLFHIILLQLPVLIGLMLPLGFYLGVLLAYGGLCVNSEMVVLNACGFSERQLFAITLFFASLVAIVTLFFSLWLQPSVIKRSEQILAEAQSGSLIETILPGRFQITDGGHRVYYVGKLSRTRRHVEDVFIAGLPDPEKNQPWFVLVAASGHQAMNQAKTAEYMVMQNGHFYQGNPGEGAFHVAQFQNYGIKTNNTPISDLSMDIQAMSTPLLWVMAHRHDRAATAELQWRCAIPISVIILTLFAVPLSHLRPRKGRYSRMVPAILVYILYANALLLSRQWISNDHFPLWLGMWWVHFLALGLGCWMLAREWPGFFRRRFA